MDIDFALEDSAAALLSGIPVPVHVSLLAEAGALEESHVIVIADRMEPQGRELSGNWGVTLRVKVHTSVDEGVQNVRAAHRARCVAVRAALCVDDLAAALSTGGVLVQGHTLGGITHRVEGRALVSEMAVELLAAHQP